MPSRTQQQGLCGKEQGMLWGRNLCIWGTGLWRMSRSSSGKRGQGWGREIQTSGQNDKKGRTLCPGQQGGWEWWREVGQTWAVDRRSNTIRAGF